MALSYDNEIDEWQNEGTEPSDSLKESGFTAGYKPPASVFNWFWNKVSKCITELQTKLNTVNTALSNYLPLSGGTMTGTLILKSNPTANLQAATKQYVDNAKTTVDSALSSTSTNPVQNKVINTALESYLPLTGGTVTGAVTFSSDDGITTKQITGYAGLGIKGTNISITGVDSEGNAGPINFSGETNFSDGPVTVNNDLNTHKVIPTTTNTYTVGQDDLRYLEGHFETVYEGGKKLSDTYAGTSDLQGLATASIVIAASDTDSTLKAKANYTCTGSGDGSIISTAVSNLTNGGKIVLLPGTYTFSGNLTISKNNIWLCGCGPSTIINVLNSVGISVCGDDIKISDLHIVSSATGGIAFANASSSYSCMRPILENITISYSNGCALIFFTNTDLDNYVRISNVTTICTDTSTAVCAFNGQNRKILFIGCIGYDSDGTAKQANYVNDNATFIGCVGYDV